MKKQTQAEKHINAAISKAKEELAGTSISNCNIEMNVLAEGATQALAEALKAQAEANESNSYAMLILAKSLKPVDVCAIKVVNDKLQE